mmetsp:Transcript_132537/g.264501  ORF Transcript_132537/g.264501 Transcript_132537/m.264501 type:complete len:85 (-) Transcript_132537:361-615(-)
MSLPAMPTSLSDASNLEMLAEHMAISLVFKTGHFEMPEERKDAIEAKMEKISVVASEQSSEGVAPISASSLGHWCDACEIVAPA